MSTKKIPLSRIKIPTIFTKGWVDYFDFILDTKGNEMREENYSIWFVIVVALFITSLITANIIAVKLVGIAGIVFPAGVIIFPVSYIVGDVLTEVYGYRNWYNN